MRQTTKAIISIASIGLIAASYKFGLEAPAAVANADAIAQAQNPNQASGQPSVPPSTPTEPGKNPSTPGTPAKPGTPNKPNVKPSKPAKPSSGSGSTGSGSGSTGSGSTGLGTGNTGSTGSGSNTGTTTPVEVTKTGSSIRYRYGTVQVSVTKTDGQITAVNLLQAGATGGRGQAFDFLVQYTVDAQGSSFSNISGATYTTAAYKQSLDAALAQF